MVQQQRSCHWSDCSVQGPEPLQKDLEMCSLFLRKSLHVDRANRKEYCVQKPLLVEPRVSCVVAQHKYAASLLYGSFNSVHSDLSARWLMDPLKSQLPM